MPTLFARAVLVIELVSCLLSLGLTFLQKKKKKNPGRRPSFIFMLILIRFSFSFFRTWLHLDILFYSFAMFLKFILFPTSLV